MSNVDDINPMDRVIAECAREIASVDAGSDLAALIRIIDAQSAEIERLTGQRQAVRLTDDQIIEIGNEVHRAMPDDSDDQQELLAIARELETAVFAANGME